MEPRVDINIAVYNHAPFLRKTLDSVLEQKTSFNYRLLIGDDCSTDGSIDILKDYEKKYPDKIKVIYQPKNLGLHSNEKNGIVLFKNSTAKYVAMLDGDDYWTDPFKLQKQIDFLENNPGIFGCFHDVVVVDENNKVIKDNYYIPPKGIFNQLDSLTYGGLYCTSSLVFRSIILKNLPTWFLKSSNDYTIDLLITEFGDIAYLNENMGAYRIHSGGTWQGNKMQKNLEDVIKRFFVCLSNPDFKKKYGTFFYKRISELSGNVALLYQEEGNRSKQIKYAWFYIYYARVRNFSNYKFLIGSLLFPFLKNGK
jgi:glycosyltransferase involved in cell wall biosynthesis